MEDPENLVAYKDVKLSEKDEEIVELKKQLEEAKKNKPKDDVVPCGSGISATPVPPVTVPSMVPSTVTLTATATTSAMPTFAVPGGVSEYPTYPGYPTPGYPYYPYPAPPDPDSKVLPPVVDAKQQFVKT